MKYKKLIFIFIFAFLLIILFNSKSFAGSLNLESLNYNVYLNTDGSANVKETWVIDIRDTNTLFKNFIIDSTKYTSITDISVVETTPGNRKNFIRQDFWQYHVNKGNYYALINPDGKFEIAWGVDEDRATRIFEISYTIIDAIKNYNDCSEFYWKFLDESSEIPADKVTGTITLPYSNIDIDDIRVWAHGPLNGTIFKHSNNEIVFEVEDLEENTMLETRVVTPTDVFFSNENTSNQNKLNSILEEEQNWANEANNKRIRDTILGYFLILINFAGIIFIIVKIFQYRKILKSFTTLVPTNPQKYFRDIPNKDSTPAQAAFLYYFNSSGLNNNIPKVMSATLLDLCIKKYISFDISPENKKDITIILNNCENVQLPIDEKIIYDLLIDAAKSKQASSIKLKDFKKYYQSHSSIFTDKCEKINTETENIEIALGNYNKDLADMQKKWSNKSALFVAFAILGIIPLFACFIPLIILAIYAGKISKKYRTLTQKGVDERELWVGLKNYMEDFSLLKEKEVPDLILWEKYLVYATTFGIAEKVLKQLKTIYPQITDYNYMASHGYTYLCWMYYNDTNSSLISSINTSVSQVCYSSGSGAGGGFSGGGGFGGGGGRNGWKIKP